MKLIICFFLLLLYFACAKSPVASETTSELVQRPPVTSDIRLLLPQAVCRSEKTFVSCLKLSKEACLSEATRFAQHCDKKIAQASGPTDEFAKRGQALGMCIEESLVNAYGQQGLKTPECIASQAVERIEVFRKSGSKFVW